MSQSDVNSLEGKRILLIIGGGIAAYKALELVRLLKRRNASVRCIMTPAAAKFVTPLSVGGVSKDKVYSDLFSLTDEAEMGHIELSRDADLLVVAPATANLLARMAQGHANDLATTALLATDKRVLIAPAMNVRMWLHPATQRNLATLKADGVLTVGPNEGSMACGEFGPGRLAEPPQIIAAIEQALKGATVLPFPSAPARLAAPRTKIEGALAGKHVLVSAGPTHEPIDPVRFIANRSSGKQGYAIAAAAALAGARGNPGLRPGRSCSAGRGRAHHGRDGAGDGGGRRGGASRRYRHYGRRRCRLACRRDAASEDQEGAGRGCLAWPR